MYFFDVTFKALQLWQQAVKVACLCLLQDGGCGGLGQPRELSGGGLRSGPVGNGRPPRCIFKTFSDQGCCSH